MKMVGKRGVTTPLLLSELGRMLPDADPDARPPRVRDVQDFTKNAEPTDAGRSPASAVRPSLREVANFRNVTPFSTEPSFDAFASKCYSVLKAYG